MADPRETGAGEAPAEAPVPAAATAGALLRRAREAQGMHIAVLAASLKVPQRKLEALERDRLDELPDATFARALAQSVCRVLKIDATEILSLLPPAGAGGLDQVSGGLNTPFRDKPTHVEPVAAELLRHPAAVAVGLLLVAALAVWLWPARPPVDTAPVAGSAAAPGSAEPAAPVWPQAASEAVAPAPAEATASAASAPEPGLSPAAAAAAASAAPAVVPSGTPPAGAEALLVLATRAQSWVEVTDAGGRTLLSRVVQAGERVALDGTLPLRLVVGNAGATELRFRGQAVDLQPLTVNNVARIELK